MSTTFSRGDITVDRIVELETGKRAVGLKHVSMSDGYLQGHFPNFPAMPGVLIVEAIAQTGCVLVMQDPANADKLPDSVKASLATPAPPTPPANVKKGVL